MLVTSRETTIPKILIPDVKGLVPLSHGATNIYAKIEYLTTTGSHKDRESIEIVKHCLANNIADVGCASTGNFAISLSAHCKMFGIRAHLWVSDDISSDRMEMLKANGPKIVQVPGLYDVAIEDSNKFMKENGIFNANPGHCSLKIDGNSSIGREIAAYRQEFDYVICPTNNGSLLKGVWQGLVEKNRFPKMIAACTKSSKRFRPICIS